MGILDAEPPLLRRIDQEQPAERPERLPAEILLAFLIDNDHAFTGVGQFGRSDKASQPGSDNNHVRIARHIVPLIPCRDRNAAPEARSTEIAVRDSISGRSMDHAGCSNSGSASAGAASQQHCSRIRPRVARRSGQKTRLATR